MFCMFAENNNSRTTQPLNIPLFSVMKSVHEGLNHLIVYKSKEELVCRMENKVLLFSFYFCKPCLRE